MVPWRFSFKIRDGKLKLVFPWRFNTPTWRKKNQNLNENQGFFKNFSGFLHFQSRNARVVAFSSTPHSKTVGKKKRNRGEDALGYLALGFLFGVGGVRKGLVTTLHRIGGVLLG